MFGLKRIAPRSASIPDRLDLFRWNGYAVKSSLGCGLCGGKLQNRSFRTANALIQSPWTKKVYIAIMFM